MPYNITTSYPMRCGNRDKDFEYMYAAFCGLIDELSYIVPGLETKINGIGVVQPESGSEEEE